MKPKYPLRAIDGTTAIDVQVLQVPSGSIDPLSGAVNLGHGVKAYRALLTQEETDAPDATVLENSLGGEVVWSYDSTGIYYATLTGAFPAGKTCLLMGTPGAPLRNFTFLRVDANSLEVATYDIDASADSRLAGTAVEVLVYP